MFFFLILFYFFGKKFVLEKFLQKISQKIAFQTIFFLKKLF